MSQKIVLTRRQIERLNAPNSFWLRLGLRVAGFGGNHAEKGRGGDSGIKWGRKKEG